MTCRASAGFRRTFGGPPQVGDPRGVALDVVGELGPAARAEVALIGPVFAADDTNAAFGHYTVVSGDSAKSAPTESVIVGKQAKCIESVAP